MPELEWAYRADGYDEEHDNDDEEEEEVDDDHYHNVEDNDDYHHHVDNRGDNFDFVYCYIDIDHECHKANVDGGDPNDE